MQVEEWTQACSDAILCAELRGLTGFCTQEEVVRRLNEYVM